MLINNRFFSFEYYKGKFKLFRNFVCPETIFWDKQDMRYQTVTGKKLNIKHPCDLNEKLMWLTRYWNHPLKFECADKYLVRRYVKSCGLEHILVPLIADYDKVEDIDFNILPKQFVLKCNHGCGYNIVVLDKTAIDSNSIRIQLSEWMKQDYSMLSGERHYHDITPHIICEELLQETAPMEYQFWCVNGEPESILVCRKNFNGSYDAWSFSLDWKHLYDRKNESENSAPPRPQTLEKMIEYAGALSKPFPFVRIDLYDVSGNIFFAETTFTPSANVLVNYKDDFVLRLGRKLVLPKKYKC